MWLPNKRMQPTRYTARLMRQPFGAMPADQTILILVSSIHP